MQRVVSVSLRSPWQGEVGVDCSGDCSGDVAAHSQFDVNSMPRFGEIGRPGNLRLH
jgi:hypothetical protein